jgi:hypothetical protein|tara:strand:- start:230 stop:1024 length:795 start_codon:yes stop_codon:yes gene_type:complete
MVHGNIVSLVDSTGIPLNKSGFLGVVGSGGGASTQIPLTSDNFTKTGSQTGWSIDDTNEKITFTWDRQVTVNSIWMNLADYLGEAIGTEWNLRYHMKLDSNYSQTSGVGCYQITGLFDQDGTSASHGVASISGASIIAEADQGNSKNLYCPALDGASAVEATPYTRVPKSSTTLWTANGREGYFETIRDGNDFEFNIYTDSDYSSLYTNGSGSITGTTQTTDTIEYLWLAHNYNYSASTWNGSGDFVIDSLYFNNNSTSAGAPF